MGTDGCYAKGNAQRAGMALLLWYSRLPQWAVRLKKGKP